LEAAVEGVLLQMRVVAGVLAVEEMEHLLEQGQPVKVVLAGQVA
jgi:hypothetical protein